MSNTVLETQSLYKHLGWKKYFAKIRFWDAPYIQAEHMLPKDGVIIEIGSGEGLFSNFISLASPKRKVLGIEIDKQRVKEARNTSKNVKYIWKNALEMEIPKASAIVMMHILHHLPSYQDQEKLLKNCIKSLSKKGTLLIVEVEPKFSIKYFITWFTDHFLVPWLFESRFYSAIYFRKSSSWKDLLQKNGLSCSIISAERGKPFTHVILLCKKK